MANISRNFKPILQEIIQSLSNKVAWKSFTVAKRNRTPITWYPQVSVSMNIGIQEHSKMEHNVHPIQINVYALLPTPGTGILRLVFKLKL